MRHTLALLACISLTACFEAHDFRFGWANHEDGPPTGAGWYVDVGDGGQVTVTTWTKRGAEITHTGTLNPAGRSARDGLVDHDNPDVGLGAQCYQNTATPCTSYELRYTDPDGIKDELWVGPTPAMAAFVDVLVAEVPNGTSRYVDGIH